MYTVIKNKGKMVKAYQLGSGSPVIQELIKAGKIRVVGDSRYEVYSREAVNGAAGGEIAVSGDWIKADSSGCPYPNAREYFEANHRHVGGDTFEQLPKPLQAWDENLEMCREVAFLVEKKGLMIDTESVDRRYTAELWGTKEAARADAMIVFYSISYGEDGEVIDADFNFVARDEFERTYSMMET